MKHIFGFSARALIGLCLGFLAASIASASVYFTPAGAGAATGADWANAYPATLLQAQVDALPVGETAYLGSGTYTNTNLFISSSGADGAPKRVVGVDTGGGLPLFQGPYVVNSGSGGAFLRFPGAAQYWEIRNLRFTNYRFIVDMPLSGTTFDLRSNLLIENLAGDSMEDGLRIRNATNVTVRNCSVIRYTKKGFRIGLYTSFMTYDGCSADCNGGDDSFPSQSIPTGFGCDDTNDSPLIHDITFVDCSARHNGFAQGDNDYWNGDGYSSERGTYNLTFIRCTSYDNHDGGFDNKANNVTFQDCIAIGNKIGYRHWGTNGVYYNCIGAYNKKLGGTSSSEGLWIATTAQVTVNFSTFHGNDSTQVSIDGAGVVELVDSLLSTPSSTAAFVSGTGSTLTRSATFRPGAGVDPLYVADSALWRGTPVDSLDNATYGLTKGYNSGRVGAPANLPPTLTASATPTSGMPPLTVQFSAAADDADGVIVAYSWDFGDGVTSFQQNPSHVYTSPGSFPARCMVRDNRGAEVSQSFPITVSLPTTPVELRIEAGSATAYADTLGQTWVADHSFGPGGGTVDRGAIEIANTVDDRLYQTERWGLSSYAILLANGTYNVKLHFAETYTGITAAGQRIFSVSAEGAVPDAWNQIDIFAQAGGRNIALVKSATVRVTDQVLNLGFIASVDNPLINAIEIIPVSNQGPDLTIGASPAAGATPVNVAFTASATDSDGSVAGYRWDFGDGTSSTLQNPSHTYNTPGLFVVSCAAMDNEGAFSARTLTITAATASPTGLTAVRGTANDVALSWNANAGATSYRLKRATTSGGPYTLVSTVATTSFTDTGLTSGVTYYYVVSSVGTAGESADSAEVSVTAKNITTIVDDADLTGVTISGEWTVATTTSGYYGTGYKADLNTGLTIAKSVRFTPTLTGGDYQVFMRWTAGTNRGSNVPVDIIHANGTTTVTVNQRLTGGQWVPLGNFHFDAGTSGSVLLRNNGANGFVIADAVEFIELEPVPPAAPGGLTATGAVGQITLSWTASIGATTYNVKRATSAGGPYVTVASSLTAVNYTDTNVIGGTTYYYAVSGQNTYGEGAAANASAAAQLGSVIVDNTDVANTIIVGDWIPATTASGYYGSNYIQDNNTGSVGGKSVTYIPVLAGGTYVVSLRWTSGSNRASNVPVEIQNLRGVSTVTMNEKTGGGAWNPIGTFDFVPGTAGRVVIRNTGTNGFVIADAVQFSQVAAPAAAVPAITSSTSASGIYGQAFQYAITAANSPSFFTATGLPAGLTLNNATGVISGTPTVIGTFAVALGAANTAGTGAATLSLTVNAVPQSITFPNPGPKTYGDALFALGATASSGLPVSYALVSGPAQLSGGVVTLTDAGTVEIEAAQGGSSTVAPAVPVRITFTVAQASQTITFPSPGGKTFGDASFTLSATASSGLSVSYSLIGGPAELSGNLVTLVGAGTIEIEATQVGTSAVSAAAPVRVTFTVARAPQSIAFPNLGPKTFGDAPFTLGAMASSGLPVSYALLSGPAQLSGNVVTIAGAGVIEIEAAQGGSSTIAPAAPVTVSFAVAQASQTIAFPNPGGKTFGDAPFSLNASASSGLAVAYQVLGGPAQLSGSVVTLTGAGTVEIEASQVGDANYAAAAPVRVSFAVAQAAQAITFPNPGGKIYGDAPFSLNASASSGLAAVYQVLSGPAQLSGSVVTLTGAGTVEIEASQVGDANYTAAAPVQISFVVAKASQAITFPNPGAKTFGEAPFVLGATAGSGLAVSYQLIGGPAQLAESTVILTGAGTVEIEAAQSGDVNYEAALPIRVIFTVAPATAEITLGNLLQTYDGLPKPVTAVTDPADLAVQLTYDGGPTPPIFPGSYAVTATLTGPNYTATASGTLVISASVVVRHAPTINGVVEGSVHVLLPESFALNSNAVISGDLLVPGTPAVRLNGHPSLTGTIDSGGASSPSSAEITFNSGATVRYLVRQIDPVALPTVVAPQAPTGTQNVSINNSSQTVANFAVVRNLTLNGNAGTMAVPPGVYGNLTANGNSRFIFGHAGDTAPAVYELQQLQLNGTASVELAGPVIIRLAASIQVNGSINPQGDPSDLMVEIANGGVTLNSTSVLKGSVRTPQGTVTVNGSSVLQAPEVRVDRLVVNSNGHLLTNPE